MKGFFKWLSNFFSNLFGGGKSKPKPDPKPDPVINRPDPITVHPDPLIIHPVDPVIVHPEEPEEPEPDPMPDVELTFGKHAKEEALSEYTIRIIKELLEKAGEKSAKVTSTQRTPADQARIMYTNILNQGVAAQKRLYGSNGDKIIDVYVKEKANGKSRAEVIDAMEDKIMEIGPSKVSRHLADPKVLQVIDIAPSSIVNDSKFVKVVEADSRVSKLLKPPTDPAFHLEIPQKQDIQEGNG